MPKNKNIESCFKLKQNNFVCLTRFDHYDKLDAKQNFDSFLKWLPVKECRQ